VCDSCLAYHILMEKVKTLELPSTASVRWQCRRGMLELDMLLLPFFDNYYEKLSVEQKKTFIDLLAFPDQELYAMLIGREIPDSFALQSMVERLRKVIQQG
jgi:antitoxin CptB